MAMVCARNTWILSGLLAAVVGCGPALVWAQSPARRPIKIEDMHAFHDVRDVQISPDGKWVAYTVNSVDVAADKSDTDVWMASWDGKQQVRLTSSPESENAPRWSPDGRYLSFLSGRPGKARGSQVWLLDRTGGEAQQFTDVKGRLSSYDWSPDSKRLLLVMADRDPGEPDEPAAGGRGGANAPAPKPIVIDRYKFKQDVVGYLTQRPPRLYLVRHGDEKSRGPDGREPGSGIARVVARRPVDRFPRQAREGCGAVQHVERLCDGSARRRRAAADHALRRRACFGIPRPAGVEPGWQPPGVPESSGAKLSAYNMNRLAVVPVAGGEPKILAGKLDRGAASPRFTRDGAVDPVPGGGRSLGVSRADSREWWRGPQRVKGPGVISTIAEGRDGRLAVLAGGDTSHPEIYALENGELAAR